MKFDEVKKDYLKLIKNFGVPNDMTGGFGEGEAIEYVILNPSKKNAMEYMLSVIRHGFHVDGSWTTEHARLNEGKQISITSDSFLQDCYKKYYLKD